MILGKTFLCNKSFLVGGSEWYIFMSTTVYMCMCVHACGCVHRFPGSLRRPRSNEIYSLQGTRTTQNMTNSRADAGKV